MQFSKFFAVDISHKYFDEKRQYGLSVEPTPQCADLLKKHRFVFNSNGTNGFSVVAKLNKENELLAQPVGDSTFDFLIFLPNQEFLSYTKLHAKNASDVFLFSNVTGKGKGSRELITTIIPKPAAITEDRKNVLGLIRIIYKDKSTIPANFTLNFEAADVKWKYYLIANRNVTALNIEDKSSGIVFSKKSITTSARDKDKISETIINNFPHASLFVFESKEPVPYRQLGRKNIQLVSNNTILIDHLPNPGLKENGIKIINTLN